MGNQTSFDNQILKLTNAFYHDDFQIKKIITKFNGLGVMAEHKTAVNYDSKQKKKVYYLQGTHYEIGYLIGMLAEKEIAEMTDVFTEKIFFSFIGSTKLERIELLGEALTYVISVLSKAGFSNMPQDIKDEIQGIFDGCKAQNPFSKVSKDRLITLNLGFDIILSMVYSGNFLLLSIPDIKPSDWTIPIMCNAFSVFGDIAGNGHYFGRDFMFPTANIFQKTATMMIINPIDKTDDKEIPYVSVTAPGIIGCISAMNINGIGIGVDMSPSANCDPENIGVNSLLLAKECIQSGIDLDHVIKTMKQTQRGVSWNYIVSDGMKDRACVVEAGKSDPFPDPLKYPMDYFIPELPDYNFINKHWSAEYNNGLMLRWNDYKYPFEYLNYNQKLWQYYNKMKSSNNILYSDAFNKNGYINKTFKEQNCPSAYYFAPQREELNNLIIATNHFVIPEMRFYAMHPWTAIVVGDKINDIQWRYDALNDEILKAIAKNGSIDYHTAKMLVDYLAPYGVYPSYYEKNLRSSDNKEISIEGCTSIFDLKKKTVESHYGYYCDEWVKITLPNYVSY